MIPAKENLPVEGVNEPTFLIKKRSYARYKPAPNDE